MTLVTAAPVQAQKEQHVRSSHSTSLSERVSNISYFSINLKAGSVVTLTRPAVSHGLFNVSRFNP